MNIDKFTEKAQEAILATQDIAVRMGHQHVDGEHTFCPRKPRNGLIPKLIGYMGQDVGCMQRILKRNWKNFRRCRKRSIRYLCHEAF